MPWRIAGCLAGLAGLTAAGAAAKRAGIRFGLWFEPERVRPGSQLDREHPKWLLKVDEKADRLLNLGLPEAQQWFVELISHYVDEVPLGHFRHDYRPAPAKSAHGGPGGGPLLDGRGRW